MPLVCWTCFSAKGKNCSNAHLPYRRAYPNKSKQLNSETTQMLYINNSNGHEQIFMHTAICRCKLKWNYLKSNSELLLQGKWFNLACCPQLLTYSRIAFAKYSSAKVLLFLFNNSLSNYSFYNVKSWNLTSWLNDRDIFCFFLCLCFLLGLSAPPILNKYVI